MTRALDPKVMDSIWQTIGPLLPPADDSHPLGCHNPRVADRVCFRGILIRLVTGSSWTDIETIMDFEPTLNAANQRGLVDDIETLPLHTAQQRALPPTDRSHASPQLRRVYTEIYVEMRGGNGYRSS